MSALLLCTTEVVALEAGGDEQREADTDQRRAEHQACDTDVVPVALGENDGEAEEERVLQ